jgi:hypothetical protein
LEVPLSLVGKGGKADKSKGGVFRATLNITKASQSPPLPA